MIRRRSAAILFALAVVPAGTVVRAAETPCVLDKCVGLKPPPAAAASQPGKASPPPEPVAPLPGEPAAGEPNAPAALPPFRGGFFRHSSPGTGTRTGSFDFYVLSLSWSPGFCASGGDAKAPQQCASGSTLGFVVHGLWPQYERGYPQNCSAGGFPTRTQIESVHDLYPEEGLTRHEWRAHGTCSGKAPADYFADVRRARQAIVVPDAYRAPKDDQQVGTTDVARAFIVANPGLRLTEMAVTCRSQMLEEVRICFAKDLRGFHPCPEVTRDACRTREITVPAPG